MKKQILYSITILAIGIGVGLYLNQGEAVKSKSFEPEKMKAIEKDSAACKPVVQTVSIPKTPVQKKLKKESNSKSSMDNYWVKPEEVTTTTSSNETSYVVVTHPVETTTSQSYTITLPPKEYVTTVSGYEYETGGRAVDGGPINPHWKMGSNGLWQNPNVDPPSCRNRVTTHLQ